MYLIKRVLVTGLFLLDNLSVGKRYRLIKIIIISSMLKSKIYDNFKIDKKIKFPNPNREIKETKNKNFWFKKKSK